MKFDNSLFAQKLRSESLVGHFRPAPVSIGRFEQLLNAR